MSSQEVTTTNSGDLTAIHCCIMFYEDAELVTVNVPAGELGDLTVQSFCLKLRQECTLEDLLAVLESPEGGMLRAMVWSEVFQEWVRLNSVKGTILSKVKGDWVVTGPSKIKFVLPSTGQQQMAEPHTSEPLALTAGGTERKENHMDVESSQSGEWGSEPLTRQGTDIAHTGHLGMVRAPTHMMTWGASYGNLGPSPVTETKFGFPPTVISAPQATPNLPNRRGARTQQATAPTSSVPRPLSQQQPSPCYRVRVFLVRHGESEGNVNLDVYKAKPDHALDLTERGKLQARESGEYLKKYFEKHHGSKEKLGHHVRMWVSPYQRTRQTAEEVLKVLNDPDNIPANRTGADAPEDTSLQNSSVPEYWVDSIRESPFLAEQDFGSFEGHGGATAKTQYREEFTRNLVKKDYQGQFWSRWPNGESCFDVCIRMAAIFSDITAGFMMPPDSRPPIRTVIIVSHGVTIRAFLAAWCRYSPEWLAVSKNPNNCSINLIEDYNDRGCVFGGFHADTKNPQSPDLGAIDAAAGARITDPRKEAWRPYLEQNRVGTM